MSYVKIEEEYSEAMEALELEYGRKPLDVAYKKRKEQLDEEFDQKCTQLFYDQLNNGLQIFSGKICQRIEDALEAIFSPPKRCGVGCAIRWRVDKIGNGSEGVAEDSGCYYPTYGRSKKLSARTYSVIDGDGELVRSIKSNSDKVILLKNVKAQDIIADDIWDGGSADFLDTIGSVLVFPIWHRLEGKPIEECELIGILYFTSKASDRRCPFGGHIGYREFGAALADILGPAFQQIRD